MQKYKISTAKTLGCVGICFLLFLAGDLFCSLVFDLIFSAITLPSSEWYVILRMLGCLVFTFFFFWCYTTKCLHLKMEDFGITFQLRKWGIILAVLLPTFVAAAFLPFGKMERNEFSFGELVLAVTASALTALKAGLLEEMLFRGFIMKLLENRWNQLTAILLPSVIFGMAHLPAMEQFTVDGVLLLAVSGTLVGIMFSLAAYRGRSISNSALIHAVWNFVMVTSILHITTAQEAYGKPLFQLTIPSDHILLTGAGFGTEASIIAMIGYAAACVFILLCSKREISG